ncbi:MAG: DNA polymerase III subunit chi [Gammaproteobacteria bacterium]
MSRVDFYVLPGGLSAERFACAMADKACRRGFQIYVHTASRLDALNLDELLWTFKDISFLPHRLHDAENEGSAVTVGWDGRLPEPAQVLINLTRAIPEFAANFERIIEAVVPETALRDEARERYRRYRELGFELHSHEIDSDDAEF